MIRKPIPLWLGYLLACVGLCLVVGGYFYLSHRQTVTNPQQKVIPGWGGLVEGWQILVKTQGTEENPKPRFIWSDLLTTYRRLAIGLSVGVAISVAIGILMGSYRVVESLLSPITTFMAKVPPTSILPVFFASAGTGEWMFMAIVVFGVVAGMTHSIYLSARKDVQDDLINKAYTLGASDPEIVYEVIWKQLLPRIIDNLRLQIGMAIIVLLAAEWMVGSQGVGYRFRMEYRFHMSVVYIYVVILGCVGLLIDFGLVRLRKWLCPWFGD